MIVACIGRRLSAVIVAIGLATAGQGDVVSGLVDSPPSTLSNADQGDPIMAWLWPGHIGDRTLAMPSCSRCHSHQKQIQTTWRFSGRTAGQPTTDQPGLFDLSNMSNPVNCVAYARTDIWSDADCDIRLTCTSSDGLRLWINGDRARPVPGEHYITASLRAGWNDVMLKTIQADGDWDVRMLCE